MEAIQGLGYGVRVADPNETGNAASDKERELANYMRLTIFCVILAFPALLIMVVPMVRIAQPAPTTLLA